MGRKAQVIENRLIDDIEVSFKECSRCKKTLELALFRKDRKRVTGYAVRCRDCESAVSKKYKEENKEKILTKQKKHYQENKQTYMEKQRKRRNENPTKYNTYKQVRRARKRNLPDDLTTEQVEKMLNVFGGKCALSDDENIVLDHFIPIASGYGGTTLNNIIPLSDKLNSSKRDTNPFVWFERNRDIISEEKFNDVINYLSKLNGLTSSGYRDYVFSCFGDSEV